jgi:TolA-binding protein
MQNRIFVPAVLAVLAVSSVGLAQDAPAPAAPAQPAAGEPRKDPKGVKGISPFWEAIKKGDSAILARDFDGAIAAYREAIQSQPQNPMGHYRLGEAQLAKGDQKEAELAWTAGLRFADRDAVMKAKLLFVLADLRERQKNHDDATTRWAAYGVAASAKDAKGYPATAEDRKKRIATVKELATQYADVKVRIEKRLKEAEEAARKSAK